MRKRLTRMTRRSLVGALVGLAFAAAAGVGLAQVTTGSTPSQPATSTTESQTTSTQTDDRRPRRTVRRRPGVGGRVDLTISTEQGQPHLEHDVDDPVDEHRQPDDVDRRPARRRRRRQRPGKDGRLPQDRVRQEHTINIAAPAVPAHVAHGDTVGRMCPDGPRARRRLHDARDDDTHESTKPKKPRRRPRDAPVTDPKAEEAEEVHGSTHGNVRATARRAAARVTTSSRRQRSRNREPRSRGALVVFGAIRSAA